MTDLRKLVRTQIVIIVLFICFKFIRPDVLESDAPELFKLVLLSLPNFFEGIVGVLVLTAIGLYFNNKLLSGKRQLKDIIIYILATLIASVYVITQELKIHNLGGNNVFDFNDLIFSVVGLVVGYSIVILIKPLTSRIVETKRK